MVKSIKHFYRFVHINKRRIIGLCIYKRRFIGFTVEDEENRNAEGSILVAVCG